MNKEQKMPPIKPLYRGIFVFFTGILIAFLGGNGLMLLIGIGVMFYGGFIMMPDAWDLYQKYKRFNAEDRKDIRAIKPTQKLPFIDVPARDDHIMSEEAYVKKDHTKREGPSKEGYYEDGMWKTRGVA